MKTKPKIFFCGGEGQNWALDHDLYYMKEITKPFAESVSLEEAEIVHSVWWRGILEIPHKKLIGKKIIASIADKPEIVFGTEEYLFARETIDVWLTEYHDAQNFLTRVGEKSLLLPDVVDVDLFHRSENFEKEKADLKFRLGIPQDRYLIANFHKDSSLDDLARPKKQKGADLLLEIVDCLAKRGAPIHLLLAGPRRHWIRARLQERGVPFTFVGEAISEDDIRENTLSLEQVAEMTRAIDLYLIPSRWEGAPNSVLEAAACYTKVLSTHVGQSPDILAPETLFENVSEAVEKIEADIQSGSLNPWRDRAYQRVLRFNTPEAIALRLRKIYSLVQEMNGKSGTKKSTWAERFFSKRTKPPFVRYVKTRDQQKAKELTFSLWHEFRPPPWGGGNQFMLALEAELKNQGIKVVQNGRGDAHFLHGHHFQKNDLETLLNRKNQIVIQRVDGPIFRYRGKDRHVDDEVFGINQKFADATIFQSAWSFQESVMAGYDPIRPFLISNAPRKEYFFPKVKAKLIGKIKLISTSWSNNPRKGGSLYKFLDENLDWNRFEYTFVGRVKETFQNIKKIDPVDSGELGRILREHDVYIAASELDPCSNALAEALTSGMPTVYRKSGGHPELVGFGGIGFYGENDVLNALDQLVSQYESYQNLIWPFTIEEIVNKLLNVTLALREIKNLK
ncbi:MAG: glycosyltransferase [Verrucomicrobiota bacterium]